MHRCGQRHAGRQGTLTMAAGCAVQTSVLVEHKVMTGLSMPCRIELQLIQKSFHIIVVGLQLTDLEGIST